MTVHSASTSRRFTTIAETLIKENKKLKKMLKKILSSSAIEHKNLPAGKTKSFAICYMSLEDFTKAERLLEEQNERLD